MSVGGWEENLSKSKTKAYPNSTPMSVKFIHIKPENLGYAIHLQSQTQSPRSEVTSDGQAEHAHDAVHRLIFPSHCAASCGETIQHKHVIH